MYVRGTPFELYDGENTPADVSVADNTITPSDSGPIEYTFSPKVYRLLSKIEEEDLSILINSILFSFEESTR